jgi:hypothetical protein
MGLSADCNTVTTELPDGVGETTSWKRNHCLNLVVRETSFFSAHRFELASRHFRIDGDLICAATFARRFEHWRGTGMWGFLWRTQPIKFVTR